MPHHDESPAPRADPPAAALVAGDRLRQYASGKWRLVGGQAVLVLLLLWATRETGAGAAGWLAGLTLLNLAYLFVVPAAATPRRDGAAPGRALQSVRVAALCLAAAWGAAALLLPAPDAHARTLLALLLAGTAAGALTGISFDRATAIGCAALILAPLSARLLQAGDGASVAMTMTVALSTGALVLVGGERRRAAVPPDPMRDVPARATPTPAAGPQRVEELSQQLQRASDELKLTLDSMDQGILSLGADGRVNFYNHRLCELVELPDAFLAGRPTMDEIARYQLAQGHYGEGMRLVDEQGRGALQRWFAGEHEPFPKRYLRRTRSGVMLEVKSHYVAGGGLVRTFSDVTAFFEAQQRLQYSQAQERKLALVAAHTDNAVVIVDAAQRVEWVNDAFTRMTGYASDEAIGSRMLELLSGPATDAERVAAMHAQLQSEHKCAGELQMYRKDGVAFWFGVETQAIVDDVTGVARYISIGRDVTARHLAEQELRDARDDAERASRAKSEFLSAMSHELRTPMNAILGFAQLLESDPQQPLPERQRTQVQQIRLAGGNLLTLINDVLDLARVEAGKQPLSLEPVALEAALDDCLALMRPLAHEREIALACRPPARPDLHLSADRTRLKQVLINLLSNAIKYSPHGGAVGVTCAVDGDTVHVEVTDNGPGLSDDEQALLFNAFERLGARSGSIQGAGIGLALSRQLVEAMSGQIGVRSEPGRGSTFWIRLPLADAPPDDTVAAAVTAPARLPSAPGLVLYIEDNPVNLLLMQAILEREPGVRLLTAELPEIGLELARSSRPDLILLDIQLPGMDGYEVLRRLRTIDALRDTPVVAISANAMRGDVEKGVSAGFDDYLTKPLDLAAVLARVRWYLHEKQPA